MSLGDRRKRDLEDLQQRETQGLEEKEPSKEEEHAKAARASQLDDRDKSGRQAPDVVDGQSPQQKAPQSTGGAQKAESVSDQKSASSAQTASQEQTQEQTQEQVQPKGQAKETQAPEQTAQVKDDGGSTATQTKVGGGSGAGNKAASKEAAGQAASQGGGKAVRFDAPTANDASVSEPLPSSFQHTEQVLNAAARAAASSPVVSPGTAAQPQAAQAGWASKSAGFAGSVLESAFVGNWAAMWDPKTRGKLAENIQGAWSKAGKAQGWDKVAPSLDAAYNTVGAVTGFLGPLGSILGIVSYARYVPIPPIPAIGTALYVVSKVISTINLVLNAINLVIAALRPIVDVLMIVTSKDPERRKKYQERLLGDCLNLAAQGFTVAFSTMTNSGFKGARGAAQKAGASRLGSLKAGFKGLWKDNTSNLRTGLDLVKSIKGGQRVGLFDKAVKDAWNNAIMFRRLAYSRVSASSSSVAGVAVNRSGAAAATVQRRSVSALSATATGKGESMLRMASGTASRVTMKTTSASALRVGSGGVTAVAGRSKSVTAAMLKSSKHTDWSRAGDVGKELLKKDVGRKLLGKTATGSIKGLGPAPKAAPPVAPGLEAGSERAAKATQKAVTDPGTPVFKGVPEPPASTPTGPGQLDAIRQQRETMKSVSSELKADAVAAKAGQIEAKGVMKAAAKHRAGAQNAVGEVGIQQQKLVLDREGVGKGRQKVAEGKTRHAQGEQGFGKVSGEGDRAKSAVPGGKVNRDDIPWYKKVFMWVVDKFEGAKAKVTNAMTQAVMKAVTGAAGLKDIGGKMNEADQQTREQEQTLAAEPAVLGQVTAAAGKEAQAASEGEQKAATNLADNVKAEQEATKAMQEAKGQESKLQQEETQVKADAATYQATYGKSFDQLNENTDAAAAGNLKPLGIQLTEEIDAIRAAVNKLIQAIIEQGTNVGVQATKLASGIRTRAAELEGEQQGQAVSRADELGAEFSSRAQKAASERTQKTQNLGQAAAGFGGKASDSDAIRKVSELHGEVVSLGRAFDNEKQQELEEMHSTFMSEYDILFD